MNIVVLGSGQVAQVLGTAFVKNGHSVAISARDAAKEEAVAWANETGGKVLAFNEIPNDADFYLNCTAGVNSLAALALVGKDALAGKILIDVANPLDFSNGFPPTLSVCNDRSLAEDIQAYLPETKVVKALNTVANSVMVEPSLVPGNHHLPIAGNDAEAKQAVAALLGEFGWQPEQILDLGDISMSRGTEMYLAMWVRMYGKFQTTNFNLEWKVAQG